MPAPEGGLQNHKRHSDRRYMAWAAEAACIGHDPEIWFSPECEWLAVKICSGCPVRRQCLKEGDHYEYGVWGGVALKPHKRARDPEAALERDLERKRLAVGQ